jgi:hypothetical protein
MKPTAIATQAKFEQTSPHTQVSEAHAKKIEAFL